LVFANRFINWVGIGEVGGCISPTFLLEGFKLRLNSCENLIGFCCVEILIIISSVVVSSIGLPVVLNDVSDGNELLLWILVLGGQDLEPCEDCPDTIFLSDVVGSCAETLLTTNLNLVGIEKVSEEFPASWGLIATDIELFADHVYGSRGWHASGSSRNSSFELGDVSVVCDNNGNAIRRSHKEFISQNHVSVGISITGGSEVWVNSVLSSDTHLGNEIFSISQVWIWVATSEIFQDFASH